MSPQEPHFGPHSTAKTNNKSTNPRKKVSSSTSAVAFASAYSDKTHLKKLIMIIIIFTSNRKTIK